MKKREKLQDAVGMVGDDLIEEAKNPRRKNRKAVWTAAVAACLALFIAVGAALLPGGNTVSPKIFAISLAEYPDMPDYPKENENDAAWFAYLRERRAAYNELDANLDSFFAATIREFLSDANGENAVYSPVNVYMALAMAAELTDGESRAQILALLGAEDIESLRKEANVIWNTCYVDDGSKTTILASSLWLNKEVSFKQDTLDRVAQNYYASSYSGEMGSEEYTKAFRTWLNEQTGGLLADEIGDMELDARTVMALATTVYFNARWNNEFREKNNTDGIFHGTAGDAECEFMNSSSHNTYYWGENFSAAQQAFTDGGGMMFILPDEGVSAEELLADEEVMSLILGNGANSKYLKVNLSVPKFDVSSQTDLAEGLKNLGVTDIFDVEAADFTPMTEDTDVFVSKVEHGVRVTIDEEGCTAAAFTVMIMDGAGEPPNDEVDFVLDRPFVFVVRSDVGLPLFVGIVNNV